MAKSENFRCKSTENGKIRHINWRTENFQFSLISSIKIPKMAKSENFRCNSTENGKIRHINRRTENFQFSLTLRLRKTPLGAFVGCPKQ